MRRLAPWLSSIPKNDAEVLRTALNSGAQRASRAARYLSEEGSEVVAVASGADRVLHVLGEAIANLKLAERRLRHIRARYDERELTQLLRSSDDVYWTRLRVLLRERGVDLQLASLEFLDPDDSFYQGYPGHDHGVLTTPEKNIRFEFDYYDKPFEQGTFSDWEEESL
jgi:hypothetical protein